MKSKSSAKNRSAETAFVFSIVILSFLLWNTFLVFPIKLFVVFLHESSHAITILLTGGRIAEISLGFDLGGKVTALGGNEIAIASSGYLGSLLFGLLIFIISDLQKVRRYIFLVLAVTFFLITVLASPTLDFILIGLITIVMLVFFAFFVRILFVKLIAKSFALVSAIYVLIDIKEDMLAKEFASDAQILAGLIGVDQVIISFVWIAVSILLIWLTLKHSYRKEKTNHL
ncbi:MAG: hypothetical protein FD143_316 [Ignavibacteria bacterium]|nr:MAG: hypothetical protein FD143_316 [Ignavibacteria bacterium]KAF0160936.1 MAG: hypothetical protein FD188_1342 [Ignavibacteria bacterium]